MIHTRVDWGWYYPPGAESDRNAPWKQKGDPDPDDTEWREPGDDDPREDPHYDY